MVRAEGILSIGVLGETASLAFSNGILGEPDGLQEFCHRVILQDPESVM
jgi:hypothetical protein